jgi:INO80 complex subunit C
MAQPSPTVSGTSTPTPSINLEALDFGHPQPHPPRPFKSPPSRARHPRRNKTLKQILQDEQKALAAAAALDTPADTGTPSARASVRGRSGRTLRVEGLAWSDIDAPPSLLPQKKYCDITGLEGRYTDPKTKLRFHNSEVYAVVQTLPASVDQEVCQILLSLRMLMVQYLALRSANVVLK